MEFSIGTNYDVEIIYNKEFFVRVFITYCIRQVQQTFTYYNFHNLFLIYRRGVKVKINDKMKMV